MIDWTISTDAQLVDALAVCGTDVPQGLPEAILDRKEGVVPLLGELLMRPEDTLDDTTSWGPVHALHLLGAIGAPAAAPWIVSWLRANPQTDYATEATDAALGRLGPGAIDALIAGIRDGNIDQVLRGVIMDGLIQIGFHNPDARSRIADGIAALLHDLQGDPDYEAVAHIAEAASVIDDQRVWAELSAAYDKIETDESIALPGDIEEDRPPLRPWWLPGITYNLMGHFEDPGALFRGFFDSPPALPVHAYYGASDRNKAKKKSKRKDQKKSRKKNRR
jgi:hypothetical protein